MTPPVNIDRLAGPATSGGLHVLLVDDDQAVLDLTAEYLQRELSDATVTTVADPSKVAEVLENGTIDCVVSDYDMPALDGLELLKSLRSAGNDLPFILFTSKGSEEVAADAISAGVDEYLQKGGPELYPMLANKIETLVAKRRSERLLERAFLAIESAQEGIGILDEDGYYEYVNEAYAAIYGLSPPDIIGEHWDQLYPADETERFSEEILPELADRGSWRGVATGVTAEGDPIPERLVLAQMPDGGHVCIVQTLDSADSD